MRDRERDRDGETTHWQTSRAADASVIKFAPCAAANLHSEELCGNVAGAARNSERTLPMTKVADASISRKYTAAVGGVRVSPRIDRITIPVALTKIVSPACGFAGVIFSF